MINLKLGNLFKGDKVIWMIFFFLAITSVIEVYSSSSILSYKRGNYAAAAVAQTVYLIIGLVVMIFTLQIKPKYFKVINLLLYGFSIITLLMILVPGIGVHENDASRWIQIGFIRFQPSEIAKGSLVIMIAQILSAMQTENGADKKAFSYILIVSGAMILPIMFENLSTAALMCAVVFMMMLVGRIPIAQLGKLMGVGILFIVLAVGAVWFLGNTDDNAEKAQTELVADNSVQTTSTDNELPKKKGKDMLHRLGTWKLRIMKFMDSKDVKPEDIDLINDGQVAYANIAIASSGLVGKGPGNSVQCDFLAQAFADFIYAIIIEEFGLIGAIIIALLYIILLVRAAYIANNCENAFPAYMVMGLALLLVTQALFNMCVAVGLAPVTGQTLPLVSRGGTSIVVTCFYLGIMLSISRYSTKKKKDKKALVAEETTD